MLLKHIIYNILLHLSYPFIFIILSILALKNKTLREGTLYRLGLKYPKENLGQSVWFHGASVGEVIAIKELVLTLISRGYKVFISTTTATGYDIAKKTYGESVSIFYISLDYPFMINKIIKNISPEYVVIAEIEIWPNLIYQLNKKMISIYLVNGRIGKKELKGYGKAKFFFTAYYNMYTKIFAQSATDQKNMLEIGMPKSLITISGNLKYDVRYNIIEEKYEAIKNIPPKNRFVIVAGSTHLGEEEAILKAISEIGIKDKVYIVIVPRNIERGKEIETVSQSLDFNLPLITQRKKNTKEGIIINIIGELLYWYKRADLVIMGGSFSKNIGGHNILEAIYFKKAVVVGSSMHNFTDMYEYMKETLFNVSNIEDLGSVLKEAYQNKELRKSLGELSHRLLIENRGASSRTLAAIDKYQGRGII